jgi:transcriptional regulator with XRE-family HTH domain
MKYRLGTFIRERRMELGLTQEQLAERMGSAVRQAEVSRLERGQIAFPRRERLDMIAAALEVSPGELLVRAYAITMDEVPDGDDPDEVDLLATSPGKADILSELRSIQDVLMKTVDRVAD